MVLFPFLSVCESQVAVARLWLSVEATPRRKMLLPVVARGTKLGRCAPKVKCCSDYLSTSSGLISAAAERPISFNQTLASCAEGQTGRLRSVAVCYGAMTDG
jgi:hypothetical protein